ncbi:hypothetical protein [Ramlibacter algicola]|uniref:Uncharacterized protein n=1 Tax=Ramlibacter algicola TaxID=2795217 RepID=A0A934UQH7_9BURK|nr:hypothetical protein [Ramlibacter algicola]MBK0391826.1 hypothetical protein [Ramlibacter algicola]
MGLFGKDKEAGGGSRKTQGATPRPSQSQPPTDMRRELLRLALRQSLIRNGIPVHWIGVEAIEMPVPGAPLHVRLVVQHWDERLLRHAIAFQDDLEQRLLAVDPLARTWLRGFSWQYEWPDGVPRPSLPDPSTWADAAGSAQRPAAPVRAREELDRLLASRDEAAAPEPDFQPTHPLHG